LNGVCRLTGLRELFLEEKKGDKEGLLLQLAQLRQLAYLHYTLGQACSWTSRRLDKCTFLKVG
jgi:hypothetical protein